MILLALASVALAVTPTSDELVNKLQKRYSDPSGILAVLVEQDTTALGQGPAQNATLWYSPPGLLRVEYTTPTARTLCAQGDHFYLLQGDGRIEVKSQVLLLRAFGAMSNGDDIKKNYAGKVVESADGGVVATWTLNPGSTLKDYPTELQVTLDKDREATAFSVKGDSGASATVQVQKMDKGVPASDQRFNCAR